MKLTADGINEHGVAMCQCGNKRVHAWEPGEWCGDRVIPGRAILPSEMGLGFVLANEMGLGSKHGICKACCSGLRADGRCPECESKMAAGL